MAEALWSSLADALNSNLSLYNLPCQHVDGYIKPEVEVGDSPELLLPAITVQGPKQEHVLIEPSVNSVRISVKLRAVEPLEAWLRSRRLQFMLQRANQLRVLRRVPVPGHDLSFLLLAEHMQVFDKARLVSFVCGCCEQLSGANDLKRLTLSQGRSVGADFALPS